MPIVADESEVNGISGGHGEILLVDGYNFIKNSTHCKKKQAKREKKQAFFFCGCKVKAGDIE